MNGQNILYVSVILPIKFSEEVFYILPEELVLLNLSQKDSLNSFVGVRVKVEFANKEYSGVINKVMTQDEFSSYKIFSNKYKVLNINKYKRIIKIEDLPKISQQELLLWQKIADYYLCSIGEVFNAAYPSQKENREQIKDKKTIDKILEKVNDNKSINNTDIVLSDEQLATYNNIKSKIETKCVLLEGVTGSGKTEIYINLAKDEIKEGKNVLFLVPEIAMSKQLEIRLKSHFGERLLCYHSKQTNKTRKLIRELLTIGKGFVVLGTRSSIFLPFNSLGLIIVDEEHDQSYKQDEPSPRYNAREGALFLSQIHKSKILLGSATPSLESLFNCKSGLYKKVELKQKYYNATNPDIILVDTIWARKNNQLKGSFSYSLIHHIEKTIKKGEQVILFSPVRSYSPLIICSECGTILKCPHCNVTLSYHRFDNSLRCHYCEYSSHFSNVCPACGKESLTLRGAGSEKIEEEIKELFPNFNIARFDADITKSKTQTDKVLKGFEEGKIDILVGTQMITKGFDFKNLSLVGVLQTDVLFGQQDFRADERALQLLIQLMGRVGRRENKGTLIIQTNSKNHPILNNLESYRDKNLTDVNEQLKERELFKFPPYVRMVNILLKNKNRIKLNSEAVDFSKTLRLNLMNIAEEITGPYMPRFEKLRDEYILCFSVKFARNKKMLSGKNILYELLLKVKSSSKIIIDVDPN